METAILLIEKMLLLVPSDDILSEFDHLTMVDAGTVSTTVSGRFWKTSIQALYAMTVRHS